jgi:aldose 1-epimerase
MDDGNRVEVAVVPSLGNRTIRMLVDGHNILYFPFENPEAARADSGLNGIPFLAPWANRMAAGGIRVDGHEYRFGDGLRLDANGLPIHGMLTVSPLWELVTMGWDDTSAYVTSRLEFWRHPALMANWPFAHTYEMTHRLANGELEISTKILNLSMERMPVAIGFHPYFQLPGVARDSASARVPVRRHVETDARLVATGEFRDVKFPERMALAEHTFDDGYVDLDHGADGRAVFAFEGGGKKIEVGFGPKYQVAVVYAPPDRQFLCFEPMTAVTNGVNLAAEGRYPELQWVAANGEWRESFWVRAEL